VRTNAALLFIALPLAVVPLVAVVTPPQGPAVFHSGTRLVEVEVVVRGKPVRPPGLLEFLESALDSGPPFGPPGALTQGLTKDDFELFDEGKPQPISVFRAGPSAPANPMTLPPGAISNRLDSRGRPINGATVVLIDFLNTQFDYTGYERLGMTNLLRSLTETDSRVALYSLGESLHVLQDFTDDPEKIMYTAAQLDQPRRQRPRELAIALGDYGDLIALEGGEAQAAQVHGEMTVKALSLIIQHLSGVPGPKNLIWMMPAFYAPPPAVMVMAQRANVVLYPVTTRCPIGAIIDCEESTRKLAAATGAGRGFYDAMDLTFAVRAAEEDSRGSYVLGFYPYENQLDGKFHRIVVKLKNPKLVDAFEVRYRTGYLATKVAIPAPTPTPQELFEGPVDATGIGLSVQAAPSAQHPGLYDLSVTVDLHDIHLESNAGHFTGSFDLSMPNPSAQHTIRTGTVAVDLTDQQFAEALDHGLTGAVNAVESTSGEIRVVVRDPSTGAAGSVRIPVTPVQK
jgi:Ca-activated chloride channel homolog